MVNFMALYWRPQGCQKGYPLIWEANLQPLGPMFQHLLGSNNLGAKNLQPKNAQSWPQVFLGPTPSVKRA
jgi:hypothetical protein